MNLKTISINPEYQFQLMYDECVVTAVSWRLTEDCYDMYKYRFTVGKRPIEHNSIEEARPRGEPCEKSKDCSQCEQRDSTFTVNQRVNCWRPDVYKLPNEYRCANDDCYRIFDPVLDLPDIMKVSITNFIIGSTSCLVSWLCACTLCGQVWQPLFEDPEDLGNDLPAEADAAMPVTVGKKAVPVGRPVRVAEEIIN